MKIHTCQILGVNIAALNMETLVEFTEKNLSSLSGEYICVANVHTTVTAFENEKYREIQNNAILTIPDGGPLSSEGRRRGSQDMCRTTGPSYMGEMLAKGYKHFFYGSTEETLKRLRGQIEKKYPNARIVGMYAPPFRPLTEAEDRDIVKTINDADPDFVWVGLGAPKQEIWMADHKGRVKGLMVGVGAAFDYYAGNIKRAPEWMQKHNLEWLYRLIQDPKRLFKRYFVTNSKFIWHAMIKGR